LRTLRGKVIKRGVITINDLISYNPSGNITIKAGETLPVTMTIRVPADLPEGIMPSSFPVNAVGITASVSAVDNPEILSKVPPVYRESTMDIPAICNVRLEVMFS
jgi:hypothetical protein